MSKLKSVITVAGFLVAGSVNAASLTFDGSICGGNCGNGSRISQNYGDIAGQLDVRYDADTSTIAADDLFFWSTGYSGQTNVAYSMNSAANASIFLKPEAGFSVTLNSLDIGAWQSVMRTTQLSVFDGLTNQLLFSTGQITFNNLQLFTFNNLTSANGLKISLGPDSWNTGVDNINFTVVENQVNPVPLPAAAWLFGSALLSFVGFSNRRKV